MSATLRCYCWRCEGRLWTEVTEYMAEHPDVHSFMVVCDERPYTASTRSAQLQFSWDEPL